MACSLILSKTLACLDGIGGIKEIKFHALPSSLTNYTLTSGVVAIVGSDLTDWFPYSLELETSSITDVATVDRAQGTAYWAQTLTAIVNKMSAQMNNEIKSMSGGRWQVAVQLMDGTYFLLGYKNGMTVTTISGGSGTAMGDRNGYTYNLTGKEDNPAPNMTQATYESL